MDLFFDLDGTLTDPAAGITRCIQHALVTLGAPCPPREALLRYIGPPLRGTFAELLETTDVALVERAVALYRERFAAVGMFENELCIGVPETLAALRAQGHRLYVVTSKPHVYARPIVAHFGLADAFAGVYGAELSGENGDKRDLIAVVLTTEGIAPAHAFMIGDRAVDVTGGRANGTRTIGVLWGYGSEAELRGAGADLIAAAFTDLPALVARAQAPAA